MSWWRNSPCWHAGRGRTLGKRPGGAPHGRRLPHAARFITPMAAVAGAVAEKCALLRRERHRTRQVNNGGDIALVLAAGSALTIGVVPDIGQPVSMRPCASCMPTAVRGVATSGWRGRSFSSALPIR